MIFNYMCKTLSVYVCVRACVYSVSVCMCVVEILNMSVLFS